MSPLFGLMLAITYCNFQFMLLTVNFTGGRFTLTLMIYNMINKNHIFVPPPPSLVCFDVYQLYVDICFLVLT